jgi:hypothetical protein
MYVWSIDADRWRTRLDFIPIMELIFKFILMIFSFHYSSFLALNKMLIDKYKLIITSMNYRIDPQFSQQSRYLFINIHFGFTTTDRKIWKIISNYWQFITLAWKIEFLVLFFERHIFLSFLLFMWRAWS